MEFRSILTERLLLRKIEQADAPFILKGLSNHELTQYMLIRYNTLNEVQEQMNFYENHYNNKTGYYWLMVCLQTGENIGVVGLTNISLKHRKAEIGFWCLPEFWSKGFTTDAAHAVIEFGFNHLQLARIEATVETENLASIATLKKLGLQHEGTFKQYEINNGKFIDLMMFAIVQLV